MTPRRRKILLVVGGVAAALVVTCASVVTYYWIELTALPQWYTAASDSDLHELAGDDSIPSVWIPIETPQLPGVTTPPPAETSAAKPRRELRGFHRGSRRRGATAVTASRAEYADGHLRAGVIVDLRQLDRSRLTARDETLLDNALHAFPALSEREVYVGIEDEPREEGGVLLLGDDPKVRVGNVTSDLADAERRVGMAPGELRREIDRELSKHPIDEL